jgi:uncharacterized protein
MEDYALRFIYDRAALLIRSSGESYLVIGDIHIGLERHLSHKGVHLYSATEHMANQIKEIAKENALKKIIMLGDIKETILYPDSTDAMLIKNFFEQLSGFDVQIAVGNHDAHLAELLKVPIQDEILIGDFALLHGHIWPSEEAMRKKYIIIAHNHVAVAFRDENKAFYNQKAWLIAKVNKKGAKSHYKEFNKEIKLIVMPAFNDLILGRAVNQIDDKHINPLFRNNVFDYLNADIYTISGALVGTPKSLSKKL